MLYFEATATNATDGHGSILTGFESFGINGGDLGHLIIGGGHSDYINGNGGDDVLNGGAGRDTLHGNDGNDTISGTWGEDLLFGDAGADTFQFVDTGRAAHIMDFATGTDKILVNPGALNGDVPPSGPLEPARLSVGEAVGKRRAVRPCRSGRRNRRPDVGRRWRRSTGPVPPVPAGRRAGDHRHGHLRRVIGPAS